MKKIEDEFIPYYLAFRMKQLGFNEVCFSYFLNGILQPTLNPKDYSAFEPLTGLRLKYFEYVLAPTWKSAFNWFKKEYKIHVSYGTTSDYHEERNGFVISNYIDGSRKNLFTDWEVGTYEEAELKCLEKLLEIVESKSE
jgi:hypothetical protein